MQQNSGFCYVGYGTYVGLGRMRMVRKKMQTVEPAEQVDWAAWQPVIILLRLGLTMCCPCAKMPWGEISWRLS